MRAVGKVHPVLDRPQIAEPEPPRGADHRGLQRHVLLKAAFPAQEVEAEIDRVVPVSLADEEQALVDGLHRPGDDLLRGPGQVADVAHRVVQRPLVFALEVQGDAAPEQDQDRQNQAEIGAEPCGGGAGPPPAAGLASHRCGVRQPRHSTLRRHVASGPLRDIRRTLLKAPRCYRIDPVYLAALLECILQP